MRLVTDMIEWCSGEMPRWHPISISGYHIREAGSTAQQELAFTLKDGFTYVEQAIERGLDVDDFAPRLSFFFNAHIDFFEEIAKYRAARRIWAREMRETLRRPARRIAADALPHADRGRLADGPAAAEQHRPHRDRGARRRARRHPVAAHQLLRRGARASDRAGGAGRASHPAGDRARDRRRQHHRPARRLLLRREAHRRDGAGRLRYFARIDELGGMVEAIKQSFPQREIADASFRFQREVDAGQRIIVGVNEYRVDDEEEIAILRTDPAMERKQVGRLAGTRARRDSAPVERALAELKEAARRGPEPDALLLDGARARATEGEMVAALQEGRAPTPSGRG